MRVRSPQATELSRLLAADGATVTTPEPGALEVRGTTPERVGELALAHGVLLHELSARSASLEEAYMSLTRGAVEYRSESPVRMPSQKGQNR